MMELNLKADQEIQTVIPPGHNAWVVGDEPCVSIDFTGLKDYAKKQG